ncbi:L-dopachrome tautomerase-related protein [Sphingobacterium sp. LRF_L2]|uniref:L-dopachrome tautomerase-related protein n=1 Tax=Sphingobacterium sp. LRF_L2 TaxID=3369421 RepID=UPI003F5F1C8E
MRRTLLFLFLCMFGYFSFAQYGMDDRLEVVASFGNEQPIGVSVSSLNRVFVSFPRREPYTYGLTEIVDGKRIAFPDLKWNSTERREEDYFVNVQDIYVDIEDQLWVLDSKPGAGNSVFGKSGDDARIGKFKLVQIDLASNKVVKQYTFDDLNKFKSGLNDVRVDTDKKKAYLSDPGQAGIVILDLRSGKSRLVLSESRYTKADPELVLNYEGHDMRNSEGKPFMSNVNGIALTKDNRYFYFKPINTEHLYRIETTYLVDASLTDQLLMEKVEDMGKTTITHGLVADVQGRIYLTSSLDYSIKRWSPEGTIETLVQDDRLIWPDSLGLGSDGYLYFSCAQVNRLPQWNEGIDKTAYPYQVYRVKVL